MRIRVFFLIILAFLVGAQSASANPYDVFSYDSRSAAMGSAFVAMSDSLAAPYFNPALLMSDGKADCGVSYFSSYPSLDFQVIGENSYMDPDIDGNIIERNQRLAEEARDVESVTGYSLVITSPLSERISAGVAIHLPKHRIIRERFQLPTKPFYLDYDNRCQRLVVLPSLAYKVNQRLSVGASVSLLSDTTGVIVGDVPLGDENKIVEISTDLSLDLIMAGIYGLHYRFSDKWSVGAAYHEKMYLWVSTHQDITSTIGTVPISIPLDVKSVTLFQPAQWIIGSAWTPSQRFSMGFDLAYVVWHEYIPPFPEIDIDFSDVEELAELPKVLDIHDPLIKKYWDFKDTIVPRMGWEYAVNDLLTLRWGYTFDPSPVPKQDGMVTILDEDTHILNGGFGLKLSKNLTVDMHAQFFYMPNYKVTKDPDMFEDEVSDNTRPGKQIFNPAFPSFEAGGSILSLGASLMFRF